MTTYKLKALRTHHTVLHSCALHFMNLDASSHIENEVTEYQQRV